jgi:hypothetical protein
MKKVAYTAPPGAMGVQGTHDPINMRLQSSDIPPRLRHNALRLARRLWVVIYIVAIVIVVVLIVEAHQVPGFMRSDIVCILIIPGRISAGRAYV